MRTEFKKRLKEAMAAKGYRQVDLSNMTGLGESNISQYCSGARTPRGDALLDLAQVLHVDAAWLLGYDVPMVVEKKQYVLETSSPGELTLLAAYRALNEKGKAHLIEQACDLTELPKYRDNDTAASTGTAGADPRTF